MKFNYDMSNYKNNKRIENNTPFLNHGQINIK